MKYWNKTYLALAVITMIGIAIIGISACEKTSETLEIVDPADVKGARTLTVRTVAADGSVVDGFDLVIEGPTSWSGRVSGSSYTLENVENGMYTIRISGNGWLERIEQLDFNGGDQAHRDHRLVNTQTLVRQNAGVPVDMAVGKRFMVPAPDGDPNGQIEVIVPAGALPDEEMVEISITQDLGADIYSDNGSRWFRRSEMTLVCEPSGLVFEEPIEVRIPVDQNRPIEEQIGELFLIDTDPETGKKEFSTNPKNRIKFDLSNDSSYIKFLIPHFSYWTRLGTSFGRTYFYHRTEGYSETAWEYLTSSPSLGAPLPSYEYTSPVQSFPGFGVNNEFFVYCFTQPCDYQGSATYNDAEANTGLYTHLWAKYELTLIETTSVPGSVSSIPDGTAANNSATLMTYNGADPPNYSLIITFGTSTSESSQNPPTPD